MLLFRASRMKTCNIRDVSRNLYIIHALPKNCQSSKTDKKCFLKFLRYSRFDISKYSIFNISNYRSFCSQTHETTLFTSEKSPLNVSKSFYVEHPDVANRSEEEITDYRKMMNITVRGVNVPKPITKFSELCLPEHLTEVLNAENYAEPTPIQSQGWPIALSSRDMVGVSQTGSGKTLAYMLPAVIHASNIQERKDRRKNIMQAPKVLVLGPTRELVQQIYQVSRRFMQVCYLRGACVYGGASRVPQLRALKGADICIATPGRLLDYLNNREVSLQNCTYLVLDEADRMLDMGFEPQIRSIIDEIPLKRQTLMWSATWPKEIRSLAEDFLTDYIHVTVGNTDLVANPNIQQNIYVVDETEKFEKFYSLLSNILENEQSKVLVFVETKRKVDHLSNVLHKKGLVAWGIHGDCSQNQRDRILNNFRTTKPSVLIATDIASRGLDITDIHHVVNYDFPLNIEDYIHRIGRTARGSACGQSHSFFKPENSGVLKDLLSVLKKSNQPINPDLLTIEQTDASRSYRPQKRYDYRRSFYNKSFGKNRMSRSM